MEEKATHEKEALIDVDSDSVRAEVKVGQVKVECIREINRRSPQKHRS